MDTEHGNRTKNTILPWAICFNFSALTTKIPLAIIDKILVPIGAGLLLPLLTYFLYRAPGSDKLSCPYFVILPLNFSQ